jgi:hypothetical protein
MEEIKQEEKIVEEIDSMSLPPERMSFKNKLIFLALLGVLIGFVIKTEAAKRVTIGFEDYKLSSPQETFDINQLEKDLLKEKEALDQQRALEAGSVQGANPGDTGSAQDAACQEGESCQP